MPKIIYRIINTTNNHFYVGQTIQKLKARFIQHKNSSKNGSETHLHRAIRKYGIENFKYDIIEEVQENNNINERECYWISTLKPEYNMTSGGEGIKNYKYTDDQKIAIGLRMIGNIPWNKNKKSGLIPWNKGKKNCYSTEQLQRMSKSRKGRTAWNKGLHNPMAANNGKSGANKLRLKAIGRKKKYLPNGKWTWEYPEIGS